MFLHILLIHESFKQEMYNSRYLIFVTINMLLWIFMEKPCLFIYIIWRVRHQVEGLCHFPSRLEFLSWLIRLNSNALSILIRCYILSFLLRCGTRPYELGTQWDLNSFVKVDLSILLTITPPEAPISILISWF